MKKIISTFLLAFFGVAAAHGQINLSGVPIVTCFPKKEYGAGSEIREIARFRNIVYFATDEGLLILKNGKWKTVCPHLSLHSLAIDSTRGWVFVGCEGEFGYFKKDIPECEDYIPLSRKIDDKDRDFNEVSDITISSRGICFITPCKKILFNKNALKVDDSLRQSDIRRFKRIASIDTSFYILANKEIKIFDRKVNTGPNLSGPLIVNALPYTKDTILIATQKNGILYWRLPLDSDDFGKMPWEKVNTLFKENYISCAIRLSDGNYAIGTLRKGLFIVDRYGKPLFHIYSGNGLSGNAIKTVYQDQSNDLWVGLENGIAYVELASPFRKIYTESNIQGKSYSAFISKDNFLYLLTSNGVFYRNLSKNFDPLNPIDFDFLQGTEGAAFAIVQIKDYLLLGHEKGVFLIKNNRIDTTINSSDNNWKFEAASKKPFVISGTPYGLVKYDIDMMLSGKTPTYKQIKGFYKPCSNFVIDKDDNIWASDPVEGVYRIQLNAEMDSVSGRPRKFSTPDGLPPGKVKVFISSDNSLCFSTSKGIYKYDKDTGNPPFKTNENFKLLSIKNEMIKLLKPASPFNMYWYVTASQFGFFVFGLNGLEEAEDFDPMAIKIIANTESILPFGENKKNAIIGTTEGFFIFEYPFLHSFNRNDKIVYLGKMVVVPEHFDKFSFFVLSGIGLSILLITLFLLNRKKRSKMSYDELWRSFELQKFIKERFERTFEDLKKKIDAVLSWHKKDLQEILEKIAEWNDSIKNHPSENEIIHEINWDFIHELQKNCPALLYKEAIICYLYCIDKSSKDIEKFIGLTAGYVDNLKSKDITNKLKPFFKNTETLKDYLKRFNKERQFK